MAVPGSMLRWFLHLSAAMIAGKTGDKPSFQRSWPLPCMLACAVGPSPVFWVMPPFLAGEEPHIASGGKQKKWPCLDYLGVK